MSRPVVIVGTGEGRCVLEACRAIARPVAGFLDTRVAAGERVCGAPVLGDDATLDDLEFLDAHDFLVSVGEAAARAAYVARIRAGGGRLAAPVVHPSAIVSPYARIADGAILLGQSAVNPEVDIGEATILDWQVVVGHDSALGACSFVGPGCRVAGRVRIGEQAFLGLGVVVIPDIVIGARSIVGAGAVVTRDIPDDVLAVGNPAQVVKQRRRAA